MENGENAVQVTKVATSDGQEKVVSDRVAQTLEALKGVNKGRGISDELATEAAKLVTKVPVEAAKPAAEEKKEEIPGEKKEELGEDGKPKVAAPVVKEEEEVDDPILGKIKKTAKKEDSTPIENIDQVFEAVKSDFGFEVKNGEDLQKQFFAQAKKWKGDSDSLKEITEQRDGLNAILTKLPPPMLESIKNFYNGEDWVKPIAEQSKFDFSKAADKQDIKALLAHYVPDMEFSEEDFEADEKPKALIEAEKIAKKKFELDQGVHKGNAQSAIKAANERGVAIKSSAKIAMSTLEQSFPQMADSVKNEISAILETGSLESLFKNQDGTFKPEAAKMAMLAKHGESTITRLMDIAAKRKETEVMEDVLSRGSDKPKPVGGGDKKGNGAEEAATKYVKSVFGETKKTTF